MIKVIKIIIVITIIIGWLGFGGRAAEAVIKRTGDIEVITDEPMFADSIVWYPGLMVEKSFQVKNRGRGSKTVQLQTENESETKGLAGVLRVEIKEGIREIWGIGDIKTLKNFFDASGISLADMQPDDTGKVFSIKITMPAGAGNEYQGGKAKFDLRIGFLGDSSSAVTVSSGAVQGTEGSPAFAKATAGKEGQTTAGQGGEVLGEEEGNRGNQGNQGDRGTGGGEVIGKQTGEGEGVDWEKILILGGILGSGITAWLLWKKFAPK